MCVPWCVCVLDGEGGLVFASAALVPLYSRLVVWYSYSSNT